MSKNTKLIIGVVVALILVTGIVVLSVNNKKTEKKQTDQVLQNEPTIAPVDSSTQVDFKQGAKKGEALLTVKNAPSGTNTIEFELSYDAQSSNSDEGSGSTQQGAVGKCEKTSGDVWECGEPSPNGRKIVLGTCSSGVCRYHVITSQIDVRLNFTGSYGQKMFEKKYSI